MEVLVDNDRLAKDMDRDIEDRILTAAQNMLKATNDRMSRSPKLAIVPVSVRYSSTKNAPTTTGMNRIGRSSASRNSSSNCHEVRLVSALRRRITNRVKIRRTIRKARNLSLIHI